MKHALLKILLFVMIGFPLELSAQKTQQKGSMKKPFLLSQQFKHSAGAGASFYKLQEGYEPVFNLAYNPSLSLTRAWSDFSFSVGTQISGGYHFSTKIDTTD